MIILFFNTLTKVNFLYHLINYYYCCLTKNLYNDGRNKYNLIT